MVFFIINSLTATWAISYQIISMSVHLLHCGFNILTDRWLYDSMPFCYVHSAEEIKSKCQYLLLTIWGSWLKAIHAKWQFKPFKNHPKDTTYVFTLLINKHYCSKIWTVAIGWPFITSVFSFSLLKKKKRPYYYVKLCLWKHKCAPLLHSPSPGEHDSNSHFPIAVERQFLLKPGVYPCLAW